MGGGGSGLAAGAPSGAGGGGTPYVALGALGAYTISADFQGVRRVGLRFGRRYTKRVCVGLGRRCVRPPEQRDPRSAGPTGAGRAAISTARKMRSPTTTSCASCSPPRWPRPTQPAMVQHRPALGLRHRRPGQGHYYRRPVHRQADRASEIRPTSTRSRMPASSSRSRTTWSTKRHHGPVGARGAPVQIRLRHRLQLLAPARRRAKPLSGGGKSSGLMSFLKIGDRAAGAIKSGGTTRRAAKMVVVDIDHPDIEDYIDWKVRGRAEGRRAGHRLQGLLRTHLGRHHEGLRQLRRPGATARSDKNPQPEARHQAVARARKKPQVPETTSSASSSSPARASPRSSSAPTTPTGIQRSLPHRLGPELQQLGLASRTSSSAPSKPAATGT